MLRSHVLVTRSLILCWIKTTESPTTPAARIHGVFEANHSAAVIVRSAIRCDRVSFLLEIIIFLGDGEVSINGCCSRVRPRQIDTQRCHRSWRRSLHVRISHRAKLHHSVDRNRVGCKWCWPLQTSVILQSSWHCDTHRRLILHWCHSDGRLEVW